MLTRRFVVVFVFVFNLPLIGISYAEVEALPVGQISF